MTKSYLKGPTVRDHAREAMFQGGIILAIGIVSALMTGYFLGVVWLLSIITAIAGIGRLLYGLFYYISG